MAKDDWEVSGCREYVTFLTNSLPEVDLSRSIGKALICFDTHLLQIQVPWQWKLVTDVNTRSRILAKPIASHAVKDSLRFMQPKGLLLCP
jgi:hypothetical protein